VLAFFIGGAIGIIAGYAGGKTNTLIMRTVDVFYAFPSVLLAIALSGALGAGIGNALLSLTLVFVPQVARIAESVTAQVRHMDYIDAARATGASAFTIIRVQVLGNVLGPIFVFSTGLISVCMILASGLSFLGLGVRPPEPGVGVDAEHPAHGDLYPAVGGGAARSDDFYHLHFVQYPRGPPACGNGD
jgi:ABC-type dipeptide/oligopeptide/nickel transport systems, permease components